MSRRAHPRRGVSKEGERRRAAARKSKSEMPSSVAPASSGARGVESERVPASPEQPSARSSLASTLPAASSRAAVQVACAWCEQPVVVRARGPLAKWCSATCRHRAWEQDRAAQSGRSAVTVVDRPVVTPPMDLAGWTAQLAVLVQQLRGAHSSSASDLDHLEVVLELALDATRDRQRQTSPW